MTVYTNFFSGSLNDVYFCSVGKLLVLYVLSFLLFLLSHTLLCSLSCPHFPKILSWFMFMVPAVRCNHALVLHTRYFGDDFTQICIQYHIVFKVGNHSQNLR